MKQQLQQLGGTIGRAFINMLKPLVKGLNQVLHIVNEFVTKVVNALGVIFGWKIEMQDVGLEQTLDDADGLADSMGTAADNAKKLKQQLQGFHELNILNSDLGDSGSGGGGGAGGGGGNATIPQYKIIPTEEDYKSELKTLNQLGEWIGESITDALNSIRWNDIYETARNFGEGLANFLNGLISPDLFGALADTIAGSLNTALHFLDSFGETFDFYEFGQSIATGINHFFENFDWHLAAETMNTWVDGLEDAIRGFLKTISPSDILYGIFDFMSSLEIDTIAIIAVGKWVLDGGIKTALKTFLGTELSGSQIALTATIAFLSFKLGELLSHNEIIENLTDKLVWWLYDGGDTLKISRVISVTLGALALSFGVAWLATEALGKLKTAFGVASVGESAGKGLLSSITTFLGTPVAEATFAQWGLTIAGGIAVGIGAYKWSEKNLSPQVEKVLDSFLPNSTDYEIQENNQRRQLFGSWIREYQDVDIFDSKSLEDYYRKVESINLVYKTAIQNGYDASEAMAFAKQKANEYGAGFTDLRKTIEGENYKTTKSVKKTVQTNTTALMEQQKALSSQEKSWLNYSSIVGSAADSTRTWGVETSSIANTTATNVTNSNTKIQSSTVQCTSSMMAQWYGTQNAITNATKTASDNAISNTHTMNTGTTAEYNAIVKNAVAMGSNLLTTTNTSFNNAKNSAVSISNSMASSVGASLNNINSSANTSLTNVKNTINSVLGSAATVANNQASNIKNNTINQFSNIVGGASSAFGNVKNVIANGMNQADSTIRSYGWYGAGQNLVNGLSNGITSKWGMGVGSAGSLVGTVSTLAYNLTTALKRAFGIHSPSKVWHDDIGLMLVAGLDTAIDDGEKGLLRTVGDLGSAVTSEMEASLGNPFDLSANNFTASVNSKSTMSVSSDIASEIASGISASNNTQNQLLREQNDLLLAILNKEVGISANDVFESVRQSNRAYYEQTGRQAFVV